MCLWFKKNTKIDKIDKKDNFSILPPYYFDIKDYDYLLNKNMTEVMRELSYEFPLMTFVIAKQGYGKKSENKNVFTLFIDNNHKVVDIVPG